MAEAATKEQTKEKAAPKKVQFYSVYPEYRIQLQEEHTELREVVDQRTGRTSLTRLVAQKRRFVQFRRHRADVLEADAERLKEKPRYGFDFIDAPTLRAMLRGTAANQARGFLSQMHRRSVIADAPINEMDVLTELAGVK